MNDKLPIQNASETPLTESNFLTLQMRKDLNDLPQRDRERTFALAVSVYLTPRGKNFMKVAASP